MNIRGMLGVLSELERDDILRLSVVTEHHGDAEIDEFNKKFIDVIKRNLPSTLELYDWHNLTLVNHKNYAYMFENFFSTLFSLKIPHIHLSFINFGDDTLLREIIPIVYEAM